MTYLDSERQLRCVMLMLSELAPGCVCMDSKCPTGEVVPHMANDGGNHPHPYGLRWDQTHEWRPKRRRWWRLHNPEALP